jgi:hypothetical protein
MIFHNARSRKNPTMTLEKKRHTGAQLTIFERVPEVGEGGGAFSPGVKRQGREGDQSLTFCAEFKNEWSKTSTLSYAFLSDTGIYLIYLLCAFAKLRKASISCVMSVRLRKI